MEYGLNVYIELPERRGKSVICRIQPLKSTLIIVLRWFGKYLIMNFRMKMVLSYWSKVVYSIRHM